MPHMTVTVKWERLSALRTPALILLALTCICVGVSVGVFMLSVPAGWITSGVLTGASLIFIAVVTDEGEASDGRTDRR